MTLRALEEYLKDDYSVLSMDFQMMSTVNFADEQTFVMSFIECIKELISSEKKSRKMLYIEALQVLNCLKEK